ncbi:MAG: EamA family transporter [Vulcanimicrobiaceae bacterium]
MESAIAPGAAVRPARALPWVALFTVWIVWGSTYLGIRFAVETMPPLLMAGVRYTIAGLLLCGAMLLWNRSLRIAFTPSQWRSLALTAFLLLVCGNGALCFAELHLASGVAALIVATVPIWMLLIDAALERRAPPPLAILGLVLGTLGIVALVGLRFGSIPIVPALIVLFGSFTWAAGSVYARRDANGHSNALYPALEMLMGGVMLIIVAALSGEAAHVHLSDISRQSIIGFLWLVGPGAIVGYTAFGYAVRTLPTQVAATYAYVNPVVAVMLGVLLAGEAITANVIVGGAAVVLSVVAILLSRRP